MQRGYFHPSVVPTITKATTIGEIARIKAQYGVGLSLALPAVGEYVAEIDHPSGHYTGRGAEPHIAITDAFRQLAQWAVLQ